MCLLRAGRKHPHQEFIQIDTKNILFICGGAFDGIDKIIESAWISALWALALRSRARRSAT